MTPDTGTHECEKKILPLRRWLWRRLQPSFPQKNRRRTGHIYFELRLR